MDPTAKANLLIFLGSMLVLAAFWFAFLGITGGNIVQVAAGVVALAGAVGLFRAYAAGRKQ